MSPKPKSRKEIIETLQNNFYNYSTFSKIFIIVSMVLSAALITTFICLYIIPTCREIINGNIVGWHIVWKICLGVILYYITHFANMFFVCLGGAVVCKEEGWDSDDFATAWTNLYKYGIEMKDEKENENFEK